MTSRSAGPADLNSVCKVVTVDAPQAVAWRVFTEGMSTWWPLAQYKIGEARAVAAVLEPFAGGRWYERVGTAARGVCRSRRTRGAAAELRAADGTDSTGARSHRAMWLWAASLPATQLCRRRTQRKALPSLQSEPCPQPPMLLASERHAADAERRSGDRGLGI